ncbi:recombination protein F [compost metagenome]
MAIEKIHEEVYAYLLSIHKNNKDFKFGVRKINRDAKLEKGYWFPGNDKYLAVSFWNGMDWKSKAPIISLIIYSDGTSCFEINDKEYVLEEMGVLSNLLLDLQLPFYNNGYLKANRAEFGTDYNKSLKLFINDEKLKIDRVLKHNVDTYPNLRSARISFISDTEFTKNIANIENYREGVKSDKLSKSYLKSIRIKDYHNIKNLDIRNIPKKCKWIFITGENGSGKTSLLQSIAIGICRNQDKEEVINENKQTKIEIVLHNGVKYPSSTTIDTDISTSELLIKGFAAYGPIRLFSESTQINGVTFDRKIARKLTFGLFHSITLLGDLSGEYIFSVRPKYYEMAYQDFLENISLNIPLIVSNIIEVQSLTDDNNNTQLLYVQTNSPRNADKTYKAVTFRELPSGTKNFVGFILDLLLRLQSQQPDVTDIANYTGIVIIDEIDLHLHPKMQRDIVVQLSQTFPNIQFIVATHSPVPLLGAPEDSIFIKMDKDDNNNITAEILDIDVKNLLPNTLLTSPIFGFQDIIPVENSLKELETSDLYNEAIFNQILMEKLEERLNSTDEI